MARKFIYSKALNLILSVMFLLEKDFREELEENLSFHQVIVITLNIIYTFWKTNFRNHRLRLEEVHILGICI